MENIQQQFPLDYLLSTASKSQYQKDSEDCNGYRHSLQFDAAQIDDQLIDDCHSLCDVLRRAEEKRKQYPRGDVNRDYLDYFIRINSRKLEEIRELMSPESPRSSYRI